MRRGKAGVPTGGMEYSEERMRRRKAAAKRAKDARPVGGPITVTRPDGTRVVQQPDNRGADRPGRKR